MPQYIDITPSWSALVEPMLAAYGARKSKQETKAIIMQEFRKMAMLADSAAYGRRIGVCADV
jgi:hypothetical protein